MLLPLSLPTGTVTFLFTDIEGSTRAWENYPEPMRLALARHDALIRQAVESASRRVFKSTGDGCVAVFTNAPDALTAMVEAQRALQQESWPEQTSIRVRMTLHTGTAHEYGSFRGQSG